MNPEGAANFTGTPAGILYRAMPVGCFGMRYSSVCRRASGLYVLCTGSVNLTAHSVVHASQTPMSVFCTCSLLNKCETVKGVLAELLMFSSADVANL